MPTVWQGFVRCCEVGAICHSRKRYSIDKEFLFFIAHKASFFVCPRSFATETAHEHNRGDFVISIVCCIHVCVCIHLWLEPPWTAGGNSRPYSVISSHGMHTHNTNIYFTVI